VATVEQRKQIPLRMPLGDFVRFAALAERAGVSFNHWVLEAMIEKAKRENGERGIVVSDQNRVRIPLTPGRVVREEGEASSGVGRVGAVSSADLELQRRRARDLAQRSGKCTADVERGVRCRLCGKMH
jgi:hypothetical protein